MLQNQFKIAFRNLLKYPLYSFINIFGLSVGIIFVVLIYLFIRHELSYDQFHENAANIYRLNEVAVAKTGAKETKDWMGYWQPNDDIFKSPYFPIPFGPALAAEMPEIQQFCRFDEGHEGIVTQGNKIFKERVGFVDANFFEMFSFPLLEGQPNAVLEGKDKVVITPEVAKKYFGRSNPIGQKLAIKTYEETAEYIVSGIAALPPGNSSLNFNILMPFENKPFYNRQKDNWNSWNTPTFIELTDNASMASFLQKLDDFKSEQFKESIERTALRRKVKPEEALNISLTALPAIHLDASVDWEGQGNPTNIYILSGIALLILLIACLNYISLALTNATGRMKEVGVRKVLGSNRNQLTSQFWLEAQLTVLLALMIGVIGAEFLLPFFNEFVQRSLDFSLFQNWEIPATLLGIALLTGIIAGGYPARILSKFEAVRVLKGGSQMKYRPRFIRFAVVAQFALSTFLIIASLVMYQQMKFINQMDLGYDKEQVMVLETNTGWSDEGEQLLQNLKNELTTYPAIHQVAGVDISFNQGWNRNGFKTADGENHSAFVYRVTPDYIPTLGLEILEGRNFSTATAADKTSSIIVNEAFVKDLKLEDPIGAAIPWLRETTQRIVGVVKDYHFLSLEHEIQPLLMHLNPEQGKISSILIKMSGQNLPNTIQTIEKNWKEVAPDKPFLFTFLEEDVAQQYEAYSRWMSIITCSTLFAIFIACLGLFGLAGVLAMNRTKEIGIRKVLGASVQQILFSLNKDLIKLALLAILIAAPIAWWAMNQWLSDFQFHIAIGWEVFALAAALCAAIALVTVSYHSIKSALINPAETLKME